MGAIRSRVCARRDLPPKKLQNCFGRGSPVIRWVSACNRTPSPPASTTAHQCLLRGVESTSTQQEHANPCFVGTLIQRREENARPTKNRQTRVFSRIDSNRCIQAFTMLMNKTFLTSHSRLRMPSHALVPRLWHPVPNSPS